MQQPQMKGSEEKYAREKVNGKVGKKLLVIVLLSLSNNK